MAAVGVLALIAVAAVVGLTTGPSGRPAQASGPTVDTTTPLGCPIGDVPCAGAEVVERLCGVDVSDIEPTRQRNGLYYAEELLWQSRGVLVALVMIKDDGAGDQVEVNTGNCFRRLDGGLWRDLLEPGFRGSLPPELRPR